MQRQKHLLCLRNREESCGWSEPTVQDVGVGGRGRVSTGNLGNPVWDVTSLGVLSYLLPVVQKTDCRVNNRARD